MTNTVFMPPEYPLMYRAVGQVQGRFIPSVKIITKGVFLTDDGLLIPAKLKGRVSMMAKQEPEIIQGEKIWSAYPHTEVAPWFKKMRKFLPKDEAIEAAKTLPPPTFWLELRDLRERLKGIDPENLRQNNNYFSVRGKILKQNQDEGKLIVRICRNKIPPDKQNQPQYQPFDLILDGFLPGNVESQFWDLDVSREGEVLILENGSFVADLSSQEAEIPPLQPQEETKQNVKGKEEQQEKEEQSTSKTQPKKTGRVFRLV